MAENLTVMDTAAKLGPVTPEGFERWVRPKRMFERGASLAAG
jgi:hypothetical protein